MRRARLVLDFVIDAIPLDRYECTLCLFEAKLMFDGELASLRAIDATHTIRVPKPLIVLTSASSSCLVTEYLALTGKRRFSRQFGEQLAR